MNDEGNHRYYTARAKAARRLADRAASPYIAAIHHDLARLYDTVAQCSTQIDGGANQPSDRQTSATMKIILVEPRHRSQP